MGIEGQQTIGLSFHLKKQTNKQNKGEKIKPKVRKGKEILKNENYFLKRKQKNNKETSMKP